MWIFTTGTPQQTGLPYFNKVIQDTEEYSAVGEGLVQKSTKMAAKDTTTAKLLQYFTYDMTVAEYKLTKNQVLIAKENWGAQGSKEY